MYARSSRDRIPEGRSQRRRPQGSACCFASLSLMSEEFQRAFWRWSLTSCTRPFARIQLHKRNFCVFLSCKIFIAPEKRLYSVPADAYYTNFSSYKYLRNDYWRTMNFVVSPVYIQSYNLKVQNSEQKREERYRERASTIRNSALYVPLAARLQLQR